MGRCISQGREEVSLEGLGLKASLERESQAGDRDSMTKGLGGQIHGWAVTKGFRRPWLPPSCGGKETASRVSRAGAFKPFDQDLP